MTKNIINVGVGQHIERAMRRYGSYVATDRAVADIRDGLKPVQRRILWSMYELKALPTNNFQKSAKTVGYALGCYHPHGDTACYSTLVGMVHARYPLIEGHGNFGGPLDPAAAMRYTEARLTPLAMHLLQDRDIGQYVPNYSDDKQEPLVLPSRVPMYLLNGSEGIGVGLAARIPPHNLSELIQAIICQIKSPNCHWGTLLNCIKGPDYGQGVLLSTPEEIADLYKEGKGTLRFRCQYHFEEAKDHKLLVVTELAPKFNLGTFLTRMKQLQDDGLIEYCADASSENNLRILVGFTDAYTIQERVIPELYTTDNYQFYAVKRTDQDVLTKDTLVFLNLRDVIQEFIDFRRGVEYKRLTLSRDKELENLEYAEALLIGTKKLRLVYKVIQEYVSFDVWCKDLSVALECTEKQASFILNTKIKHLAKMNIADQKVKIKKIQSTLNSIEKDLGNIDKVIIRNLQELLVFSDDRGMSIGDDAPVLKVSSGTKWLTSNRRKITRLDEAPQKGVIEHIAVCAEQATIITENNFADTVRPHYFAEQKYDSTIVGMVGDACTKLVVLDDRGLLVAIKLPQKRQSYQLIKGATKILSAVGLQKDDKLILISTSLGCGHIKSYRDIITTRPFVYGTNWFQEIDSLYVLPKNAIAFDRNNQCTSKYIEKSKFSFTSATNDADLIIIGDSNYVTTDSGKRYLCDRKEALRLWELGAIINNIINR